MIKKTIRFYDTVKDGLPKESGYYICILPNVDIPQVLEYSLRHRQFNCSDILNTATHPIKVLYYGRIPKFSL